MMRIFGPPNINKLKKKRNFKKLGKFTFHHNNNISQEAVIALEESGLEALSFLINNFSYLAKKAKMNSEDAQKKLLETIVSVTGIKKRPPLLIVHFLINFANSTQSKILKISAAKGLALLNPEEDNAVTELFYSCIRENIPPYLVKIFIKALRHHLSEKALTLFIKELNKDKCKKEITNIGVFFGVRGLLAMSLAPELLNSLIVPSAIAKILVSLTEDGRQQALNKSLKILSAREPYVVAKALLLIDKSWIYKYFEKLNLLSRLPQIPNVISEKMSLTEMGCKLLLNHLKTIHSQIIKMDKITEREWESVKSYVKPLKESKSGWEPYSIWDEIIFAWAQFDLKKLVAFEEKTFDSILSYLKPGLIESTSWSFKGERREIYPSKAFGTQCVHILKYMINKIPANLKAKNLKAILQLPDDLWENVLKARIPAQFIKLNLNELKELAQKELTNRSSRKA